MTLHEPLNYNIISSFFPVPMCSPPDLLLWNQSVPEKNSPVSSKLQKHISKIKFICVPLLISGCNGCSDRAKTTKLQ